MKLFLIQMFCFLCCTFFGASSLTAQVVEGRRAKTITVSLERGPNASLERQILLNTINLTPHLAVWIEDKEGRYVDTIYVSLKSGKQDFWVGNRKHPLPVWEAKKADKTISDVVSGASPSPPAPAPLRWTRNLPKGSSDGFWLWVEVNLGFDYNKTYPERNDEVWGQPSLLYRAYVENENEGRFELVGKASGTRGAWTQGIEGIDSALGIFANLFYRLE